MNRENILKVRDVIADLPPERLFMYRFLANGRSIHEVAWSAGRLNTDCNTCGCIAGWTAALLAPNLHYAGVEREAGNLLGLDEDDANALFWPEMLHLSWAQIQPSHAVRVLDHLLETGNVDWSIIDTVTA